MTGGIRDGEGEVSFLESVSLVSTDALNEIKRLREINAELLFRCRVGAIALEDLRVARNDDCKECGSPMCILCLLKSAGSYAKGKTP